MSKAVVVLLVVLLGVLPPLFGQGGLGTITGRVLDPSGAVVTGAQITLTNTNTNVHTQSASDNLGLYHFSQLIPGSYSLSAEVAGFRKLQRTGITIHVDDRLSVDLTLELGNPTETVSVSAEASQLRTEDAQTGEVINNQFVQNLPQLQRDPLALITLSANVQGTGTRAGNILTMGTPNQAANVRSDTTINGGRTSGVEYFVDGLAAGTGRAHSVSMLTPVMEAVDEFKVVTNGISAEYGRLSGGAVAIVTKSGTNSYHGQAFEYLQNNVLNANTWQQNSLGGKRTPFGNNDFGFALGGPVTIPKIHKGTEKTFFFVNYEGIRFRQSGLLQVATLPTELERQGDMTQTIFGGYPARMWDPNGDQVYNAEVGAWQRVTLLGGDGKHVPADLISPVSLAMEKLTPLPNRPSTAPGCSGCNNYVAPQNQKRSSDTFAFRVDHYLTSKQRLFFRLTFGSSDDAQTAWLGPGTTAPQTTINQSRFGTINYDWAASPTLVINLRGGIHHDPLTSGSLLPGDFDNASIGYDAFTQRILGPHNNTTASAFFMGDSPMFVQNASAQTMNATVYEFSPSATKILGRHTLRFGYDLRRYYDNLGTTATGSTNFLPNAVNTYCKDDALGQGYGFSNGMGPFLMGIDSYAFVTGGYSVALNTNYHGAYLQDDFRFNPRLTLNLGVRWDYEMSPTERQDKLYFWDPNAPAPFKVNAGYDFPAAVAAAGIDPASVPTPDWVSKGFPAGAIAIAGTPSHPGRTGTSPDPHQFAPRVGFAYQWSPKTVVRGSFGAMYLSTTGDPYALTTGGSGMALADAANAGWHASNDGMRHFISTWANPYTPGDISVYTKDPAKANWQASAPPGPALYDMTQHQPYELTWTIGVQRELPGRFLLETYYSANRGIGLLGNNLISRFPKALFVPSMMNTMISMVASPTAGQTSTNSVTGPQQELAFLFYPYPYFATVNLLGSNIGRSSYNAWIVRAERRFSNGFSMLFNYSYSRLLDNVGGPEYDTIRITDGGVGYKSAQSVDNITSTWGLSPLDRKHRLSATYLYELPVGRGKHFLSQPGGAGLRILNGAVGGWAIAGTTQFRTGTPVTIIPVNENNNNNVRVEWTYGSWATNCTQDSCLGNPAFKDNSQVLYSPAQVPAVDALRRFDPSAITPSQPFVYGNLPPIFDIRNPGFSQTDLSLMKKFGLFAEGRFLQLRLEALNAFNQRGYGPYTNSASAPYFGMITAAGNVERHLQVSARLVF